MEQDPFFWRFRERMFLQRRQEQRRDDKEKIEKRGCFRQEMTEKDLNVKDLHGPGALPHWQEGSAVGRGEGASQLVWNQTIFLTAGPHDLLDCWIWKLYEDEIEIKTRKGSAGTGSCVAFFSSAFGDNDIVDSHDTHKISIINCDSANHLFSTPTPCLPSFPTRIWSNKRRTGRDYCPAPVAFVDVNNSSKNIRSSSDVLDSCGC